MQHIHKPDTTAVTGTYGVIPTCISCDCKCTFKVRQGNETLFVWRYDGGKSDKKTFQKKASLSLSQLSKLFVCFFDKFEKKRKKLTKEIL